MHILLTFFFTINVTSLLCQTCQYRYPVGFLYTKDRGKVFFIKQVAPDNIELWSYDTMTDQSYKELPAYMNPACFRILPNKKGFSFLDNGRIRIKYFDKRSPKSIDIYQPVYEINYLNWKNSDIGYFHAKYCNNYGIFQIYHNGQCDCILWNSQSDCFYPQVIGDKLFFIERSLKRANQKTYSIMTIPYPKVSIRSQEEMVKQIISDESFAEQGERSKKVEILSFGEQPIAYLNMITKRVGFVLTYPIQIDNDNECLNCSIWFITYDQNIWHKCKLFSLSIPCYLLFDLDKYLHEGISVLVYFIDLLKYWIVP